MEMDDFSAMASATADMGGTFRSFVANNKTHATGWLLIVAMPSWQAQHLYYIFSNTLQNYLRLKAAT